MATKLLSFIAILAHTRLSLGQITPSNFPTLTDTTSIPTYSPTGPISVVSAFLYNPNPIPVLASVISANPNATTYHIECPTDVPCDWRPSAMLTISSGSVYDIYYADDREERDFTMALNCTAASSSAVCHESFGGREANFPGTSDETYSETNFAIIPVTITAGLEKLTAAATTTGSAGGSKSTGNPKQTGNSTMTGSASSLNVDNAIWISASFISLIPLLLIV